MIVPITISQATRISFPVLLIFPALTIPLIAGCHLCAVIMFCDVKPCNSINEPSFVSPNKVTFAGDVSPFLTKNKIFELLFFPVHFCCASFTNFSASSSPISPLISTIADGVKLFLNLVWL